MSTHGPIIASLMKRDVGFDAVWGQFPMWGKAPLDTVVAFGFDLTRSMFFVHCVDGDECYGGMLVTVAVIIAFPSDLES